MPVGALLAPEIAAEIGVGGGLLGAAETAGIGAALGAGLGAAFGALTGEGPAKGAEAGAIGGAAAPLGGAAASALGLPATVGTTLGGAAGGALGGEVTGTSPLLGAVAGGASGLASGLAAPGTGVTSATVSPTSSAGATGAGRIAGSPGAASAIQASPLGPDPTAGGGPAAGGTATGGGPMAATSGDFASQLLAAPESGSTAAFSETPNTAWQNLGLNLGGGAADLLGHLTSNPMLLAAAAPLALQLMGGQGPYPGETGLQNLTTNLDTQGQTLSSYVQSGTLPPGAQANLNAATEAAKAQTRSAYARAGLTGSTMEAQELADIDQRMGGQQFLMASNLLSQGLSAEQLAAGGYRTLISSQMARDQEFSNALSRFAGALAGGAVGTNRNLYPGEQPTTQIV